jgi:hypothetical protein
MARRRKRSAWSRLVGKALARLITDVAGDVRRAHAQATKPRPVASPTMYYKPDWTGVDEVVHRPTPLPPNELVDWHRIDPERSKRELARMVPEKRARVLALLAKYDRNSRAVAGVRVSRETRRGKMSIEDYAALTPAQRRERLRSTGLCGAPTKDGSGCLNPKGCSIPAHRRS